MRKARRDQCVHHHRCVFTRQTKEHISVLSVCGSCLNESGLELQLACLRQCELVWMISAGSSGGLMCLSQQWGSPISDQNH